MVLFLNKKKLQEQKPLVNNTYQGKYDYSKMQYLPEDQRLSLLQRITPTAEASEVARDTNKKSLWDIFFKKPKMVFPVGEGLTEEQKKKAQEVIRQPVVPDVKIDYPSAEKTVSNVYKSIKKQFTPRKEAVPVRRVFEKEPVMTKAPPIVTSLGQLGFSLLEAMPRTVSKRKEAVPVRRVFEKEPVMTKAPPIVTSLGQLGFSLLEAIPRALATFYGEVSAPERETGEVDIGINAKRLGYENEKYRTAAKEFKDKVEAGENPWIAGLNVVSNKTLDVAFGAQLISSISRFITRKLTSGAIDRKLAKETVDAFKKNQKQLFESTKNLPFLEREKALADLTNARDVAERVLIEKGLPTTLDKARIATSKYTDILGRETSIGRHFWSRFAQPDINIKPTELAPSPIAGLLPGERPKPGQAPNIGLSLQEVEGVGKPTTNTLLTEEAKILRGTKGMTADDIMAKYPNIKLKRDIPATTINGVKTTIKEGEKLTPYELKGNKILLQDGKTYIVSKNQFQNIKGQSVVAEGKPFAPELEGVDETVKGASKWRGDELYDNGNRLADIYKREDKWYYRSDFVEESPAFKTRKEAMENAEADVLGIYSGNETKYSQYTLPGGENYREILIKAPESKVNEGDLISFKDWKKDNTYGTQEEYNKVIEKAKKIMDKMVAKDRTFISSHWDEPNVISHIRLNDRTYKGKKVTFMEELQSDWAREGRDKGFIGDNKISPKLDAKNKLEAKGYTFEQDMSGEGYFVDKGGEIVEYDDMTPEVKRLMDTYIGSAETFEGVKKAEGGVPNNPLLKNWQELSIKRALKDAVDNNSDYFAWINGEQTSARYNLATKLDSAEWKPAPLNGHRRITLNPKDSSPVSFTIDGKGIVSDSNYSSGTSNWNGKKLDEVLGKGLADKIMEKESGTLSGEGLKFGGEWASNLYDKQVKNIVEDLTGQKVEMLDMGLPIEKAKETLRVGTDAFNPLKMSDIKVGQEFNRGIRDSQYIITDVLGDGKFKAVPKDIYRKATDKVAERMRGNADPDFNFTIENVPGVVDKTETFDISQKTTQQQGIKLTPEVKNKIKGIAPKIKTSGNMFEVKTEEIKSEIPKPAVIQGETFTLGTSKTKQPTIKELKLDLKATQKEIKNAQIAREKANKLERKEQKVREEAIANLQRFRGNTENIKAELEKRNLSQEDIDNIILEDGTKLNDTIKVKRNSDGSLSDVITKKEIDDLKASYTDEIPKNKWQKRNVLVDGKEVATNAIQSIELPYAYFERKGLSSIYDQVIKSGRDAEVLKNSFIQKFKDADLFKNGSWFTADRFNIDKTEAKAVSEYYLGRQGKTKPVELSSLPEKSQKFIKVFDEIINETTEPFYQMASKMGKQPGVVENYAPLMTAEDIKLIDQGGYEDWLFRKHPAFSALKERVKNAPVEIYEKDYRKVATRWLEGMSQFLEMSDTTNHLKYLIGSDEFQNIVKNSDYAIISKWLKDITTPKTPDTLIKKTFTPLSKLTRKGVAMGSLALNYATVLKQALTQIPITIIEKSPPKMSSKYAKAFGINVKDLPSISKRKGDIAIQDLQGKISRIFTGSITQFDKMNAQRALNGLLDKEYSKFLKSGAEITPQIQKLIEKNAQDKIDMWFGGFFKGQRPEVFREEAGNFILMFTYPITSQLNGFFRHIFKAKGFGTKSKAIAEVLASVVGIAYMEKVIENLSLEWSDEKEMTKDILISLTGNIPLVGDIAYSIATGQSLNISPVISNIDNIVRAIRKGDGEKIAWTLAETAGLPKQIRRVKEGLKIMEDGGITDNNGKMLAPVQGAMEYIRAFLRGKYGPLASQDYMRNVGAKNEDKRWFFPEVEFLQNAGSAEKPGDGSYQRKAEIYKTFDRQKKKEFYNMLSEGQQKKLDNALKGITPKSEGRKSLSEIFK